MTQQTRVRMTAAEFEALPESNQPIELIGGVLVVRGVPTVNHQRVVLNTATRLRADVPGGEVFVAPVSVKFEGEHYYQPDVIWVADDSVCEVTADGLNGPPDLVVEVISPGTARDDRGIKFQIYQASGVREYWIIEPDLAFLEVWVLLDGRFTQQGVYAEAETFQSPVLGYSLTLTDIFPPSNS